MKSFTKEDVDNFIEELNNLTKKYGLVIDYSWEESIGLFHYNKCIANNLYYDSEKYEIEFIDQEQDPEPEFEVIPNTCSSCISYDRYYNDCTNPKSIYYFRKEINTMIKIIPQKLTCKEWSNK
jgi:hypothetical protein